MNQSQGDPVSSALCGFRLCEEHIWCTHTSSCLFHHYDNIDYGHIKWIRCHLFSFILKKDLYTHKCVCVKRPCISWDFLFCPPQRLPFSRQGIAIKEIWQNSKWRRIRSETETLSRPWGKYDSAFYNVSMTFLLMNSFICMRCWSLGQAQKINFSFKFKFMRKFSHVIHVGGDGAMGILLFQRILIFAFSGEKKPQKT